VSFTLRQCRETLALSQLEFATQLGVPLNTYRTWDSGRRPVRITILARARALAGHADRRAPLSLETLALILGVHVRTLRTAARDGRLKVTYTGGVAFGKPVPRTTRDAGDEFMRTYYKQSYRWNRRSVRRPVVPIVPADYPDRVRRMRTALRCSMAQFAAKVGAANKAVVYQWEARKRTPSPMFWRKVEQLERAFARRTRAVVDRPLHRAAACAVVARGIVVSRVISRATA
jgi:DNA-binding transcriptional regulator YiaG